MQLCAYALKGYDGLLVEIEIDLRRGIPGTEIIGLPDSAVKEAKERVRAAIKNSNYNFPRERLLINLTPANIKKEGAHFDLAIALAILQGSGDLELSEDFNDKVLALGELELSGRVRAVPGILAALATALEEGVEYFIIPHENMAEAEAIVSGRYFAVKNLTEACEAVKHLSAGAAPSNQAAGVTHLVKPTEDSFDFADIKGQLHLKRALEVAAAGKHNLFLFGPPGSGKTLSMRALPSILPDLNHSEKLETNRIYSLRGELTDGLIQRPPFRSPHHSASSEGIIGGGKFVMPGEISLAHNGVLFLDESFEFGKHLLQNLREPLEAKRITLARAGQTMWYPADFQLMLTANVCPCGSLGRADKVCLCSPNEVARYWKRLGGAVLDRVDMRLPVKPVSAEELLGEAGESSAAVRARVEAARRLQKERYLKLPFNYNSAIGPAHIKEFCRLDNEAEKVFLLVVKKLELSSRASHSVLKVSRTIADLAASRPILPEHILEAASYRRYGDNDLYWTSI